MNKKIMIFTIFIFVVSLFCQQAGAYWDGNMDKGIRYYDARMWEKAIEEFDKVLTTEPEMAKAHQLRGLSYLQLGDINEAQKSFQSAVAMDIKHNHRVNEAIRLISAKQIDELRPYFEAVVDSKPEVKQAIVKEFFAQAQQAIAENDYDSARRLFVLSTFYDISRNKTVYDFLVQTGNVSNTSKSVILYNMALMFTQGKKDLHDKIGYKFIKLAAVEWPKSESNSKDLQNRAAEIIGQGEVHKYFPPSTTITIFEKTYTYDDAFEKEHGQIHTFKFIDDGVNIGDKIEVIAQSISASSFSGDEIWIFQCGKCQSQWAKTANGYYVDTVEQAPQGKYFLISLGGRQDIKVIVRATKVKYSQPNLNIINEL